MNKIKKLFFVFALLLLSSCATYQHQTEVYHTNEVNLFKITMDVLEEQCWVVTEFDEAKGEIKAGISSPWRKALYLDAKVQDDGTVDIVIDPSIGISADTKSAIQGIHAAIKKKVLLE